MTKALKLDDVSLLAIRKMLISIQSEIKIDELKDDFTVYDCYAGGCSNVCDGCTGCTSCDGCSGGCSGGFTYG